MKILRVNWFRSGFFALLAVTLLVFTGCVPKQKSAMDIEAERTQAEAEAGGEAESLEKAPGVFIELVSVVGNGDAVLIEADGVLRYTAYKLLDPSRLVIDMAGVNIDKVSSPIIIDNNFLTEIVVSDFTDGDNEIARIEIGLQDGIAHDVKSGEGSILVDFEKEVYVSAVTVPDDDLEVEDIAELDVEEVELIDDEGGLEPYVPSYDDASDYDNDYEEMVDEAEDLDPATVVLGVESFVEGDATVVKILTDGSVGNFNSFGLDDPARIVLDLWGLTSELPQDSYSIELTYVDRVRIGSHDDKVRIVFDSNEDDVPLYTVDKRGAELVVVFGELPEGSEIFSAPIPIARVSAPATYEPDTFDEDTEDTYEPSSFEEEDAYVPPQDELEEFEPSTVASSDAAESDGSEVMVRDVGFSRMKDKARLTIVNSEKAKYDIIESMDGRTLTIDISSAFIPEDLRMTLDAVDLDTPVNTISSFQSSLDPDEVRIIVKLNEDVLYDVTETRGTINIDFPLASVKKATPETKRSDSRAESTSDTQAYNAPEADADEVVIEEKVYTGEIITLEMVDAQILDVLSILAEVSGLNIVALPSDVSGTITLKLIEVPWDQAFDLVLRAKGLGQVLEGNIVRVAPLVKIRKEKEEALAAILAEEKLEPLETEYIRINYDKAVSLASQIKSVLTDRGTAMSHEPTNTLIIKDSREGIEDALDFIKRVDIPTPQVLIEARIVEAETSFARDLGVQWGMDFTPDDSGQWDTHIAGASSTSTATGVVDNSLGTNVANYAVNLPAAGSVGTLGALGFILGKTGSNPMILDLRISAGERKGLVKTISRPRIITLDNMEAKIEQGESIPFGTISDGEANTEFIDANLSLTVTPQITPDGSVLMAIKATSNLPGSIRGAGNEVSINKKEASTNVLVKNGETTVIGGIIVSGVDSSEQGIPYLKDIPLIGWLFKSKSVSDTQRELLIFITPTIIDFDSGKD